MKIVRNAASGVAGMSLCHRRTSKQQQHHHQHHHHHHQRQQQQEEKEENLEASYSNEKVNDAKYTCGLTMFGVTTPCVTAISEKLEADGHEPIVFHATGKGSVLESADLL
jgi:hypothetical protein